MAALLACLLFSQTGCSVWRQARRTLISEPAAYSWKWDRSRSLKTYRRWADEAWLAERGGCPDVAGDADYALGFRDGFVDYIYAGGSAEPPPVPPRQYWNVALRGPDGKSAAAQWFSGYRHGATVARAGGLRESGVVASSYAWGAGMAGDYLPLAQPVEDLGPADEVLPEPIDARASEDLTEDLSDPSTATPELTLPESPPGNDETPGDGEAPVEVEPPANESAREFDPAAAASTPIRLRSVDMLKGALPTHGAPRVSPASEVRPEPEPAPPTTGSTGAPRVRSASAVERFRRAVSTEQFVEPRATK